MVECEGGGGMLRQALGCGWGESGSCGVGLGCGVLISGTSISLWVWIAPVQPNYALELVCGQEASLAGQRGRSQ